MLMDLDYDDFDLDNSSTITAETHDKYLTNSASADNSFEDAFEAAWRDR